MRNPAREYAVRLLPATPVRLIEPRPSPITMLLPTGVESGGCGYVVDGGIVNQVTIRAASCRGRSHAETGDGRQDRYAIDLTPDQRRLVVAVADGVSLASAADLAAEVACRAAVSATLQRLEDTANSLTDKDFAAIMVQAATEIERACGRGTSARRGSRRSTSLHGPATTLTLAVIPADGHSDEVQIAAVGNSAAVLLDGLTWRWITETPDSDDRPEQGLHQPGTRSLPHHRDPVVHTVVWPYDGVLVLMTDGLEEAMGTGESRLALDLAAAWRRPPAFLDFLRDVDYRQSTRSDDQTAVAVWHGRLDERYE